MQQRLQRDAAVPISLYAVHGHYADAGEAAALMAHTLGVPMVLTGHSLGRNKLDHLLRRCAFPLWPLMPLCIHSQFWRRSRGLVCLVCALLQRG